MVLLYMQLCILLWQLHISSISLCVRLGLLSQMLINFLSEAH